MDAYLKSVFYPAAVRTAGKAVIVGLCLMSIKLRTWGESSAGEPVTVVYATPNGENCESPRCHKLCSFRRNMMETITKRENSAKAKTWELRVTKPVKDSERKWSQTETLLLLFSLWLFPLLDRTVLSVKGGEIERVTCSKGPRTGIKPMAAAVRTVPLYVGCLKCLFFKLDIHYIISNISAASQRWSCVPHCPIQTCSLFTIWFVEIWSL